GDQGSPAGVGGDGNLKGIDPRDAVMSFDIGFDDLKQHRVLPTNRVCVYAPRFAAVRATTGATRAIESQASAIHHKLDSFAMAVPRSDSKRLVQNQAAELARERQRAQGLKGKVVASEGSDMKGLDVYHNLQQSKVGSQEQGAEIARNRVQPVQMKEKIRLD